MLDTLKLDLESLDSKNTTPMQLALQRSNIEFLDLAFKRIKKTFNHKFLLALLNVEPDDGSAFVPSLISKLEYNSISEDQVLKYLKVIYEIIG